MDDEHEVIERVKVGDNLPVMEFDLNDGTHINNAFFAGNTVVLAFFNTTCGDCQKELPELQQFYEKLPKDGTIKLIAISRAEGEPTIKNYWADHSLTIPYSAQTDRKLYNLFATSIVPRIYVADPSGKIIATFHDNPMPTARQLCSIVGL